MMLNLELASPDTLEYGSSPNVLLCPLAEIGTVNLIDAGTARFPLFPMVTVMAVTLWSIKII